MKKVKDIGYESIQVSGFGPIDPFRLKDIVDKFGLEICVTHITYDRLTNDIDSVIRDHKLWMCKYVGLGAMPQQYRCNFEGYYEFIQNISVVAERLSQSGLQFVYHNHKFEFEKFGDKIGLDILFENTDPKTFGFEIDTYWVQAGGANPVDWIKKVEGRMAVVHFNRSFDL